MSKSQQTGCFVLPPNPIRKGEGGLRTKGFFKKYFSDKPLISIITVVFNEADRLSDTIESVLNQDYPNIEYIVIDGGSTDSTVDIIRQYEDRIDYWVSEPDTGIYDAMNKGWRVANDQSHILFLGSGDRILNLPDKTRGLLQDRVIYGVVHREDGTVWHSTVNWTIRCHNTLHHQALLVPKQLHPEPPFDTVLKVYGDFDFNQRLFKAGTRFVRAPEFDSFACKAGASAKYPFDEYVQVIRKNFGPGWAFLTILLEFLKRIKRSVIRTFRS